MHDSISGVKQVAGWLNGTESSEAGGWLAERNRIEIIEPDDNYYTRYMEQDLPTR